MPWTHPTTRVTGFLVTAAVWNPELVDNLNFLNEVAYAQQTSDQTATGTTVGAANQIVTATAVTYEAVPHLIEFFCPRVEAAASVLNPILRDGTTVLGSLSTVPGSGIITPFYAMVRVTPTAASHTYNVAAWNNAAGTATFRAGAGGAAGDSSTRFPLFIRITRIPT